jgi:23S rRNA pseudouridine1911/1915/1917 synthase
VLAYRRLRKSGRLTLVEIRPETGRSHQIRVQLSNHGWPIAGDKKYGSKIQVDGFIGLHAASLTFQHPTSKETSTVSAEVPKAWSRLDLG